MREIKSLTIIGGETYNLGKKGVSLIKDASIKYSNSYHVIFDIYKDGEFFAEVVNCPVVVIYK